MDVLQAISGNRVNYSMNRIGGVNRDIEDPRAVLAMVEQLEAEMVRTVIPIFTTSTTARSRCAGIGVLTHEKAISCGVVGPVARASGVPRIFAAPLPTPPTTKWNSTCPRGARRRRARAICWSVPLRSWRAASILRQALAKMPPGEWHGGDAKFNFVTGTSTSRVEAPARRSHVLRLLERGTPETRPESMCARLPL
jgi:Ni,Fe-hydrogenase III large subunit